MRSVRTCVAGAARRFGHSHKRPAWKPERLAATALLLAGFPAWRCVASEAGTLKRPQVPLQARLDVPLDSRRMTVGSLVYASALFPWAGADCALAKGGTISGRVIAVEPHKGGANGAELRLLFDKADCNGQRGVSAQFLLYAVVEMVDDGEAMMHDRAGLFGSTSPHPVARGGPVASTSTSEAVRNDVSGGLRAGQPNAVKAGQVLGDSGVAIDFSKEAEGLSQLRSPRRDFRINAGSQLILIAVPPRETSTEPALEHRAAAPATSAPVPLPRPRETFVDETEVCAVNCVQDSGAYMAERSSAERSRPAMSASVVQLGYRPTPYRPRTGFDHETTLSFLGNDQLLLTFDTHHLRERSGESWHASTRRSVRAALLDASTLHVERMVEWRVDDDGQYLWKAGPGRVLVHRQDGLHLIGGGLQEIATFPAHGDLLWVTTSPSGNLIAFAVRQERHDHEAHDTIKRLSGVEPVEDVEMRLVNGEGKVLLSKSGDTTMRAPVLTDKDEVVVQAAGLNRWRLVEQSANGPGARTVGVVGSSCVPKVSAPLPESFFVVGCSPQGGRWFRFLRESGRAVVTSRASEEEVAQSAVAGSGDFGVSAFVLAHPSSDEVPRSAEELERQRIQVRRERDGKLLLEVMEREFPPSRDAYALSPDGTRLATMTRTEVELRTVDATANGSRSR